MNVTSSPDVLSRFPRREDLASLPAPRRVFITPPVAGGQPGNKVNGPNHTSVFNGNFSSRVKGPKPYLAQGFNATATSTMQEGPAAAVTSSSVATASVGSTKDRLDDGECIVTTDSSDACLSSPSGTYSVCLLRGECFKHSPGLWPATTHILT